MARKKFEKQMYEWLIANQRWVSREAYTEYLNFVEKRYPDVCRKKAGRPKAKEFDFFNIITLPDIDLDWCYEPVVGMWALFDLWGSSAKELAKMAYCLLEMGIIIRREKEDDKLPFKSSLKDLYNIFTYYKFRQLVSYDLFARTVKDFNDNLDYYYPKEERFKDQERVNAILPEIEDKLVVWAQGIDGYTELNK